MAKTVQAVGSSVTHLYLNSINGTTANSGHVHDNLDQDGSAPFVEINDHTVGTLKGTRYCVTQTSDVDFSFDNGLSFSAVRSMDFCRTGSICTMRLSAGEATLGGTMANQFNFIMRLSGGWPSAIFGTEDSRSALSTVTVLPPTSDTGCYALYTGPSNDIVIVQGNGDPFASGDQLFFGNTFCFMFVIVNGELDL